MAAKSRNDSQDNDNFQKYIERGRELLVALTPDRLAFLGVGIAIGFMVGVFWMRSDNRIRRVSLEQQQQRVQQQLDDVIAMKGLSKAELAKYITAVHEQSVVARQVQERLHEQELALTAAESKIIYFLIICVVIVAIVVALIHRSIGERARITIQNALGLPPEEMREYLIKSQIAATAAIPDPGKDESGTESPHARLQDSEKNRKKKLRHSSRNGGNRDGGRPNA
ncbi:MAG: hypothetical protein LIQ31_05870 [Planctomycetes bacterium]|nr:hypothetical protein [Planctomycetota bacterium]